MAIASQEESYQQTMVTKGVSRFARPATFTLAVLYRRDEYKTLIDDNTGENVFAAQIQFIYNIGGKGINNEMPLKGC